MVVQWLIDFVRDVVVNWIRGVPQVPEFLWDVHGWLVTGGYELNLLVSKFGVLVPWGAFGSMVALWLIVVGFWSVMLVVRLVAWAAGR